MNVAKTMRAVDLKRHTRQAGVNRITTELPPEEKR